MKYWWLIPIVLLPQLASAQDKERVLEFHYVYDFSYPKVLDRDNIAYQNLLPGDVLSSGSALILKLSGDAQVYKVGSLLTGLLLGYLEQTPVWAEHEYGHFNAFSRGGLNHYAFQNNDSGEIDEVDNIFEVYSSYFKPQNFGATVHQSLPPELNNPQFDAIMEAGGVNQVQHSLEILADRIRDGRFPAMDFLRWFLRLNEVQHYDGDENNDLKDYVADLKALSIDTSVRRIKNRQWFKYLSGSSMAMFRGIFNWALHDEYQVRPWLSYWPEIASYLTTQGTTLKIYNPVEISDYFTVEPSIQFSLDVESREYGLKIAFEKWFVKPQLAEFFHEDGGHWREYGLKISPWQWLEFGVSRTQGDGFTFEREIVGKTFSFLKEKESSWKFSIGVYIAL
jgi:hypothetical protein